MESFNGVGGKERRPEDGEAPKRAGCPAFEQRGGSRSPAKQQACQIPLPHFLARVLLSLAPHPLVICRCPMSLTYARRIVPLPDASMFHPPPPAPGPTPARRPRAPPAPTTMPRRPRPAPAAPGPATLAGRYMFHGRSTVSPLHADPSGAARIPGPMFHGQE
jgi:hypothetical protein